MSFSSTNINAHNNNDNDNMANSPIDFVSADVNEVLQEVRQILTNREQRRDGQHPNERVLDDSTTVQVTKQDGDEDPKEVTVLRKRLVKHAEEEEPLEEAEAEYRVSETSTITTMDLPLNCEVFKFMKLPVQRNFIWGLGQGIYRIFRQKLLKKTKRVRNPHGNRWNGTTMTATITADGLNVIFTNGNVFAVQPFLTSGPQCRADDFPGTICYYYEIKGHLLMSRIGFSGAIADRSWIGGYSNSYALAIGILSCYECSLAGESHDFELPEGAIRPEMKEYQNVFGCGLILEPDNKLAIFFTLNGQLLGRKIPISPTVDRLFPAVSIHGSLFVTNFGGDPAKPFEYDIQNCPGLGLACI